MIIRNHPFRPNNEVHLLQSGTAYFSKLEQLINEAVESIHIQVYIFNNDHTGKRILDALLAAVDRGVEVYLVVDAYASKDFTNPFIDFLHNKGLHVKRFAPLHLQRLRIGRRLHHKIVLVDGHTALVGGINIADHYSGYDGHTPWMDVAVVSDGPVVYDLKKICYANWPKRIRKKWKKQPPKVRLHKPGKKIRVLQNDWWRRRIEISSAYNAAIRNAQEELIIVTNYFLPGFTKRRLLKKAADRGVKVSLITAHDTDIPFMNAAIKYSYGVLLKNKIDVYEWNKSVLHAKMLVADKKWSTIGSYNVNALSDYGSLEVNLLVEDESFGNETHAFLESIILEGSTKVDAEAFFKSTNYIKQAYRWASYKLMRVLLLILFILMNRDKLKQ
jgi:cardiolipin synthase